MKFIDENIKKVGKEEKEQRKNWLERNVIYNSSQVSDTFLQTNYKKNTEEWIYFTNPIPEEILKRGRNIVTNIIFNIVNHTINNNIYYTRFMNGENVNNLTLELLFENVSQIVNQNKILIINELRKQLGNVWVPLPKAPINIYTVKKGDPMEIDSKKSLSL